jgi:uncharacterized protein (TIGR02001 family)
VQHFQSALDEGAASPIVAFAASEPSCALLEAPFDPNHQPASIPSVVAGDGLAAMLAPIADEVAAKNEPPAPSQAGPQASPWSANIALVSDYRIGGVTSSGHGGALQGGVDYAGPSGWSAGIWSSTISATEGSNVEVDLYGAKSFEFGDADLSIGGLLIVLPGGNNTAAGMLTTSLSAPIGPVDATLAARYAWPQGDLDNNDDFYVSLNGKTPIGRVWGAQLTLGASVGFERGEFAVEAKKMDWSVSLTMNVAGVDFGLSYVDTDLRDKSGAPGCIFSITRTF